MKQSCDQVRQAAAFFISNLINIQYLKSRKKELVDSIIKDFATSQSYVLRKCYIMFCTQGIKVLSFKTFKEYFLEHYFTKATDQIAEVRTQFLNSGIVIRPYLEHDVDLFLRFNNYLDNLQMDNSNRVSEVAKKVNEELRKARNPQQASINEQNEKVKLEFLEKLESREKFEEEEKKKRSEDQEDCKFDYLTLLVNTTKKYGNQRKGGGANGMMFKHQVGKKTTLNTGMKQYSPVIGKSDKNTIGHFKDINPPSISMNQIASAYSNTNSTSQISTFGNAGNSNISALSTTSSGFNQIPYFKRRIQNVENRNQSGLFPPISIIKEPGSCPGINSATVRSIKKSDLILQSQISNANQELGMNSVTNQNHLSVNNNVFSHGNKRSLAQKYTNCVAASQDAHLSSLSPNANYQNNIATLIPSEVQHILKKNSINTVSANSNNFQHSNTIGGPYSNNYLSNAQPNSSSTYVQSANRRRQSSEDLEKIVQANIQNNAGTRSSICSQNQKH